MKEKKRRNICEEKIQLFNMIWSFKPIFGVCSAMIFHSDTCGHILKCHLVVVTLDLKVVFLFVLSLSLGRECSMKLKWRNVAWTKRRKIRIWSKFKNPDFPKVWKITKYDHCARSKLTSIRKKSPIMRTNFLRRFKLSNLSTGQIVEHQ